MKILYAIQGTGNGHLARATEIVPILREMADTDVLVSGSQADIKLPFSLQYQHYGISFIIGKHGGVALFKTILKLKPVRFIRDLIQLPVHDYDLVISDFEPVSAWACRLKGKKCIGLSHQNAVLHSKAPRPSKRDLTGELILKYYAPATVQYGFHFKKLDDLNSTPVIRKSIKDAVPKNKKHYTVYLPSLSNREIEKTLALFPSVKWEVFSKHNKEVYSVNNIHFYPISLEKFNHSFIHCEGILCNAGFETPAEALHMGKKLCVIPMKHQYEQACNAEFLREMGVLVLPEIYNQKHQLENWINSNNLIRINYPDNIREILKRILYQTNSRDEILFSAVKRLKYPPLKLHLTNSFERLVELRNRKTKWTH
ncbi:glycosyltransferase family protein [uncultured Draconibacterium sp.]|uniref:glycosyltransferase family protein n=1 Tax=uncultured Draconibacterium sp. TaxID=1573823 RepID=UPI003216B1BF